MTTTLRKFCFLALLLTTTFGYELHAIDAPVAKDSAEKVFQRAYSSVFVVEALDKNDAVVAFGSGIAVRPDRIITNKHVLDGSSYVRVRQGKRKWNATIVREDADQDLCELRVEGLKATPASLRKLSTLKVGERVYAIGSPKGLELTFTGGMISGIREMGNIKVIQTDAAISPGSSGGGLFDSSGVLVGFTTFSLTAAENLNFAMPADWATKAGNPTRLAPSSVAVSDTSLVGYALRGYKAEMAKDYAKAAQEYQDAVRQYPDFAYGWFALGWAHRMRGNNIDAVGAYNKAIELYPSYAPFWSDLCLSLMSLHSNENAITACNTAISLDRTLPNPWGLLGLIQIDAGQNDAAVSSLTEAIRLKPDNFMYWLGLGRAQLILRRFQDGLTSTEEAVHLEKKDPSAWRQLGLANFMLDRHGKAAEAFKMATSIDPNDVGSWEYLGAMYAAQGKHAEVIEVYQKLRGLDAKAADKFFTKWVMPSSAGQ